jgi:hypothetical protein
MAGSITRRGPSSWRPKFEAAERDPATRKCQTRYLMVRGAKPEAAREMAAKAKIIARQL